MTLLEEVLAAAPPAYSGAGSSASTLLQASAPGRLPTQLWLAILAHLVEPRAGRRQSVAGWAALHRSVRFVCKELYLVSMHMLRSRYLLPYLRSVRSPFTSDPYPSGAAPSASQAAHYPLPSSSALLDSQARRETRVLDLFIAGQVVAEMDEVESDLMLDTYGIVDLFALHQPQARMEDLVLAYGTRADLILSRAQLQSAEKPRRLLPHQIRAEDVSVAFGLNSVALRLPFAFGRAPPGNAPPRLSKRTVVTLERERNEKLEATAMQLVAGLKYEGVRRCERGGATWYEGPRE